jgi:Helix-turn-helix domain
MADVAVAIAIADHDHGGRRRHDSRSYLAELAECSPIADLIEVKRKLRDLSDKERAYDAHMKGHGANLPRKKEAAIQALLSCRNIEEAAKVINVSPSTLQRWMGDTEFARDYWRVRRQAVRQSCARFATER